MLTLPKIELYARFKGDIDGFSRSGKDSKTTDITNEDWVEIAALRQALFMVHSGLASPAFIEATERRLLAVTGDDAARSRLRDFSDDYDQPSRA